MSIGLDITSDNLIYAKRNKGTEITYKYQNIDFVTVPLNSKEHTTAITEKKPFIEKDQIVYLLGYDGGQLQAKKPINKGIINSNERDAYKILQIVCGKFLEKHTENETICYSTPDESSNLDINSHTSLLNDLFKSYRKDHRIIKPTHISQGQALVFAELGLKQRTGIGINFNYDSINFCYSIFGVQVNSFSVPINLRQCDYQLVFEELLPIIKAKTANINSTQPLDIIVAGAPTYSKSFVELFKNTILNAKLTFSIGEVKRPDDYIYTVARGCLVYADVSN